MTLNDYSILVAKHGEEWVRKMFPRSVKDLKRRLKENRLKNVYYEPNLF